MASLTFTLSLRYVRPLVVAALAAWSAAAPAEPIEQAIKASYITKFAPFIEWPPAAFSAPGAPFLICLAGKDAFGSTIDELARGQTVRGRPVQLRRLETASISGCQMLVIGAGTPDALLAQAVDKPILTISDKTAGLTGGMIRFVLVGARVRFEIDNRTARALHLAVSSKLLSLAVTVIQ